MLRKRSTISNEIKRAVWDKSDGRCWYCGQKVNPFFAHYDHFEPHSKGGKDTIENLVLSCPPCNRSKAGMYIWDWRMKLANEMGLSVSRQQFNMLKSEGIDYFENPYIYETVLLFYFERNEIEKRKPELGYQTYHVVVNYKGWTK